jgi:hypothetical protein
MPNEIYHKSNWGNANAGEFGDVYFDAAATNKLYNHSDYYENSDGTDKILRDIPNKASIVLTPTAYSDGSLNTVIPPYQVLPTELVTNGDFSDGTNGWTINGDNFSIVDGALRINRVTNTTYIQQNVLTSGKKYKVEFDVLDKVDNNGTFIVRLGSNNVYGVSNYEGTRFSKILTSSGIDFRIYSSSDNGVIYIDNVSVKEIQEADFDFTRGSIATRVNEQGLIESIASNLPRIDYTSGFGSLLLEPQRTNLITYSEDFSQWQKLNSTVTSNDVTSPDGKINADLINYDITSSNGYIRIAHTASSVVSFYVKYKDIQWLMVYGSGLGAGKFIDIENNIIGANVGSGASAEITNVGNGWKRVVLKSSSSNITQTSIYAASSDGSYATVTLSGGVYLWGAQAEAGSYPTSYISTEGSTVTRAADVANNSGNADLFNDSEGVLYVDSAALADDGANRQMTVYGTGGNSVRLYYHTTSNTIRLLIQGGGTTKVDEIYTTGDITLFHKIAGKYKDGDTALWINGFEVETSNATLSISGLSSLNLETSSGGTNVFLSKIKELAVFKEALTDAELENLTSWVSFTEMATDLEYTLE